MLAALLVFSVLLAGGGVVVEGEGACPAPADVARRLERLLPAPAGPGHLARVTSTEREVRIELRDGERVLADRTIAGRASCDDRAAAAAVVIATWEVELRGIDVAPPAPVVREKAPPPPTPPVAMRPPAPARELGLALGAVTGPGGPAAAGSLGAAWGGRRLRLVATVRGHGARTIDVGTGEAEWRRLSLGVGGRWVWLEGTWMRGTVDVEALAAWVGLRGEGFARLATLNAFDPGAALTAACAFGSARVRPFVAVTGSAWLVDRTLRAEGPGGGSAVLPRGEVWLTAGVGWADAGP